MEILRALDELGRVPGPIVVAIGVFDGVHLGHRAVLGRALSDAAARRYTAVALTFDPHPAKILRPDRAPRLLTSSVHRRVLMAECGIPYLLELPFTEAFAQMEASAFVASLHAACKPLAEICVGHEWCFGKNRQGNLALLREMGSRLGFEEVGVPAVIWDGAPISSTRIRHAVRDGNLAAAAAMLGRPYTILGTVRRGAGLGSKLGFPTANLAAHNEQFPPDGVYAVHARIATEWLPGIANLGVRPTVASSGERLLEVHIFDRSGDWYGLDIEIRFARYLRGEKRFENLAALQAQIAEDIRAAKIAPA